jgi:hypothetical protein
MSEFGLDYKNLIYARQCDTRRDQVEALRESACSLWNLYISTQPNHIDFLRRGP